MEPLPLRPTSYLSRRRRVKYGPPRLPSPLVRVAAHQAAVAGGGPAGGMRKTFARRMDKQRAEWGKSMRRTLANVADILKEEMERVIYDACCQVEEELLDVAKSKSRKESRKYMRVKYAEEVARGEERANCTPKTSGQKKTLRKKVAFDKEAMWKAEQQEKRSHQKRQEAIPLKAPVIPLKMARASADSVGVVKRIDFPTEELSQSAQQGKSMPDWLE